MAAVSASTAERRLRQDDSRRAAEPASGSTGVPSRTRILRVTTGLAGVSMVSAAAGFITGPLQARALGAAGRGDLAAILVPLMLAPQLLGLSMGAYASRESARGMAVRDIVGSLGGVLICIGAVGGTVGFLLADELAGGRSTVETFLKIGFLIMPFSLFVGLIYSLLAGMEEWRKLIVTRLIPVVFSVAGIVALYVTGTLTVATAAAVTLAGSFASSAQLMSVLRGHGRPRFKLPIAREGVVFGVKTWVGGMASLANQRLDQLVMIPAVAPRELGLYAVAVTLSSVPNLLTGAVAPPLLTRISQGDRALVPRALRTILAAVIALNLAVGAVTPALLPLAFGSEFRDAVDMALVLLVATVPSAGVAVLMTALVAGGRPEMTSVGEFLALLITAAGLFLLLGPLGGLGAAIVSLAAYSANFVLQLAVARRMFGGRLRDYLVLTADDARWLRRRLIGRFR
jgi:O-antigen/teichoic acid export membrane protein